MYLYQRKRRLVNFLVPLAAAALLCLIPCDAYSANEVTELSVAHTPPVIPPPAPMGTRPLDSMTATDHPRILIPDGGLAELILRGQTTHAKFVSEIRSMADGFIASGPNYTPTQRESVMRREMRKPGQLAWAYAATGDTTYRDAAIEFALVACTYPQWDIDVDLAAGHGMLAISQVYDWFYDVLTPTQRNTIVQKVEYQGNLLNSPFGPVKVPGGTWWTKELLQNHGMVNCAGLFAGGAVFYHDIPDAAGWLANAEGHFDKVFQIICDDGSSIEGMNYWGYSSESLLLYAEQAKRITGRDFFATSGHLQNLGTFLIAQTTPWLIDANHCFPYGHASFGTGTHGPYHTLYGSAGISRNPRVQHMGDRTWDLGFVPWSYMLPYVLLWYDPTVGVDSYLNSPTANVLPELGIVTLRNSWDTDATAFWFKCGHFQGQAASDVFGKAVTSGHARPDQMTFQVITRGKRMTAYGNGHHDNFSFPLFRGYAQYGERSSGALSGSEVYGKVQPQLQRALTSDLFDYVAGDAGGIYKTESGLNRFRRHIVFLKPDDFLMIDDIGLDAGSSAEPDVKWQLAALRQAQQLATNHWVIERSPAAMDVIQCLPGDFQMSTSGAVSNSGNGVASEMTTIYRLSIASTGPVTDTVMVTYLHCRGIGDPPPTAPQVSLNGRIVTAQVQTADGPMQLTVDLDNFTCQLGAAAEVIGRYVFYNNSALDLSDPGPNAADDAAIATDKTALLGGGTATFANYTNYWRGINGVMIDIANLPGALSAADFALKVGNDSNPAAWSLGPVPTSVTVRSGQGAGGSDRVTLIWADNAIEKQWLEVTVLANANTALASDDVFYFGNAIGETGNSPSDAEVTAADEVGVRNNPHTLSFNPADITNTQDFNRDRKVGPTDAIIVRDNATNSLTTLQLINVP